MRQDAVAVKRRPVKAEVLVAHKRRRDLTLALLRQERAGGIDKPAPGRQLRERAIQKFGLNPRERADGSAIADMRQVGMTADRAGRGTGRVEQNGVEVGVGSGFGRP